MVQLLPVPEWRLHRAIIYLQGGRRERASDEEALQVEKKEEARLGVNLIKLVFLRLRLSGKIS